MFWERFLGPSPRITQRIEAVISHRMGNACFSLRFGTTLLTSLSFSYLAPVVAGDLRLSGSTSFVWKNVRVDHRGVRDLRSTSTFLSRESGSTGVFEVARTTGNGILGPIPINCKLPKVT